MVLSRSGDGGRWRVRRASGFDDEPDETTSLRQSTVSGVRWSVVSLVGRQLLRLAFTLVLARLVGPESFGIVAQATVLTNFLMLFQDQGFGASLVQRSRITSEHVGSVLWVNVGMSAAMALALVVVAPLVGDFFHTDETAAVVRALAISVAITGFAVVPRALLQRRLQFRTIAIAEVVTATVGGTAGVVAAVLGADYWAFVVQVLVTDILLTVAFLAAAGVPPSRGSRATLRELWPFSSRFFGSQVLTYANRNLDNVLVGRVLGPLDLAYYALSYRIMMLPVQNLGLVLTRVAMPVYSRVQDELDRLRRMFLASTRLIAAASFPTMILVILAAPDLVPLVFGDDWNDAVVPMQILAVSGLRLSLVTMTGPVFFALGRVDLQLRTTVLSSVLLVIAFAIGLQHGIIGVAIAYTVASTITDVIMETLACRLLGTSLQQVGREVWPSVVASVVLVVTWAALAVLCGVLDLGDAATVIACGVGAAAGYVLGFRLLFPQQAQEIVALGRETLRRPEPAAT